MAKGNGPGATFELGDPHVAPIEAETRRIRSLQGAWRWLLIGASALTIFLCINQQFVLRFFIGFTPLNTEYYYALVLVMLPFVFVLFPGGKDAPLGRVPWRPRDGAAASTMRPRSAR